MASEASRSTSSVDSYIGSLISLTSKSQIRYEGVLFNINTQEASIGLRNVRSFGTEGRRKDGAQVPASDKVYEYIVFRGSDIKDLQVKSSPPVQTTPPVHNDPAIIQSQYAAPTTTPSVPVASAPAPPPGSLSDLSTQAQAGVPRPNFQTSIPMYTPGGGLASWSGPTPSIANASGLSVPVQWHGYYGPAGPLQPQPQSLLRPSQGLTQSVDFPPSLLQPIVSSSLSMQSNVLPAQSSAPAQAVSTVSQNAIPSMSPVLPNVLDKSTVPLVPNQEKLVSSLPLPLNSMSEPPVYTVSSGTSSSPALVTPGQFLQPGSTVSQTLQKDVEVVQASSLASAPQPPAKVAATVSTEVQAPLLPLPSPSNAKINGVGSQNYVNRVGRDRGRGSEFARPVANFTEDFDFEAMNEKFKKDEVWGHLGKNKATADDGLDPQDEDEVDVPKIDVPVYNKDDFFDTLSCNALDRDSRNGRPRFSEQRRLDTETFGDFPRNRGYRGGRGPGRGGWSRGGYYGRGYGYGYGYGGRGRGQNNIYRPI